MYTLHVCVCTLCAFVCVTAWVCVTARSCLSRWLSRLEARSCAYSPPNGSRKLQHMCSWNGSCSQAPFCLNDIKGCTLICCLSTHCTTQLSFCTKASVTAARRAQKPSATVHTLSCIVTHTKLNSSWLILIDQLLASGTQHTHTHIHLTTTTHMPEHICTHTHSSCCFRQKRS